MNSTNYEGPHCEAFSTTHSHPTWAQIFASGSCFQIHLAWIPPLMQEIKKIQFRGPVWRFRIKPKILNKMCIFPAISVISRGMQAGYVIILNNYLSQMELPKWLYDLLCHNYRSSRLFDFLPASWLNNSFMNLGHFKEFPPLITIICNHSPVSQSKVLTIPCTSPFLQSWHSSRSLPFKLHSILSWLFKYHPFSANFWPTQSGQLYKPAGV